MGRQNILIVDDEKEIVDLIEIYLKNDGYGVYKANNGRDALCILDDTTIHLVLLDIMMPGIDGLEVCRQIRKDMNIPIIMLSAKSQDMDKILGLTTGADDYITKPFNPLELLARVKSQLRRYLYLNPHVNTANDEIVVGGITINKNTHTVIKDHEEIPLTPTEFGILYLLASSPGRVFSSEEIFERVWKDVIFNQIYCHGAYKEQEKIEDDPQILNILRLLWG